MQLITIRFSYTIEQTIYQIFSNNPENSTEYRTHIKRFLLLVSLLDLNEQ